MLSNPLSESRPLLAASVLSADFRNLAAEIDDVAAAGADFLHLDIMDGHFVNNISFGPPIIAAIRKHVGPNTYLDAHLMISEPLRYAPAIVKSGANSITFQVETTPDPVAAAKQIRQLNCHAGITLNPATPLEKILPALSLVDFILIMSVVPGFSGQAFMPEVLQKVRDLKPRLKPTQRIEIDGGIHPPTINLARQAGVDWFVVGSALFDNPNRKQAVKELSAAMHVQLSAS